jgi:hypothetical protein
MDTELRDLQWENATLRAVAKAAADYLGWQDGTIPEAERASGAAHRTHLFRLLKIACPEMLHGVEGNPQRRPQP